MRSEILLYGYSLVCLCMLAFNVVYNILLRHKNQKRNRNGEKFAKRIEMQLERLCSHEDVEQKHLKYLRHKLSRVNNLIAFEHGLKEYMEKMEETDCGRKLAFEEYCRHLQEVFLYLAAVYQERNVVQTAYYAWFLSKYIMKSSETAYAVQDIVLEYIKKESLYCRINALQALYEFGSEESIVKALIYLDRTDSYVQDKILTDGLLSFTGDHAELICLIWEQMDSFSDRMQLPLLNYIRFQSGDYCENMFHIMADADQDKELRLSAIRYLGKYYYAPARQTLLDFASDKDPLMWEYASVSISALAGYPGEDTVKTLIDAMHRSNWYIRYNAAVSLEAQGLGYNDLIEVVGGHDRYAREMMMYRIDAERMRKER